MKSRFVVPDARLDLALTRRDFIISKLFRRKMRLAVVRMIIGPAGDLSSRVTPPSCHPQSIRMQPGPVAAR